MQKQRMDRVVRFADLFGMGRMFHILVAYEIVSFLCNGTTNLRDYAGMKPGLMRSKGAGRFVSALFARGLTATAM